MQFLGRNFYTDQSVHRPRPSTEFITGEGYIPFLKQLEKQNLIVADIGVGSGVTAISCALECSNVATVYGIDFSANALEIAARNLKALQADQKVELLQSDLFESLMNIPIDVLLINLPFASKQKITDMAKETSMPDEPLHTIFGGETGFELYERLFKQLEDYSFMSSLQGIWIICAREHLEKVHWHHQHQFSRFKLVVFDDRYKTHFVHCLFSVDDFATVPFRMG